MSIREKYTVKPIDSWECHDWILNKHYARRIPPIEYSFGLYLDFSLCGIVTFGTPVSNSLRNIWNNVYKVIELNRLVVNDNIEKNTLSYFVSNSISLLPKPTVLVSYADTAQNHNGYIYQATNWIYTGLSADRTDFIIDGMESLHGASIVDKSRGMENRMEYLKTKYEGKYKYVKRSRKHRYFYFTGSKTDKKIMKKMLPYEIQSYPKGDNIRYDASYKPQTQIKLF